MLFKELPTAFPWFDNQIKQDRFRLNVENVDKYGLISPRDTLLPFQFRRPTIATAISAWKVKNINTGVEIDMMPHVAEIRIQNLPGVGYTYFTFPGETALPGFNLPEGFYESFITWGVGDIYYSEIFRVPNCSFDEGTPNEFIKVQWYNDTDINPIFYNDIAGDGKPYFKNVAYLDTFIHLQDPEIIQDTEGQDGAGNDIVTFEKVLRKYKIVDMVPDFLKVALVVMTIHDHILLTTRLGARAGEVKDVNIIVTPEFSGAFSTVELTFEEDLALIKKGCADNMV